MDVDDPGVRIFCNCGFPAPGFEMLRNESCTMVGCFQVSQHLRNDMNGLWGMYPAHRTIFKLSDAWCYSHIARPYRAAMECIKRVFGSTDTWPQHMGFDDMVRITTFMGATLSCIRRAQLRCQLCCYSVCVRFSLRPLQMCHLGPFAKHRVTKSWVMLKFTRDVCKFIDKFHMRGHVGDWQGIVRTRDSGASRDSSHSLSSELAIMLRIVNEIYYHGTDRSYRCRRNCSATRWPALDKANTSVAVGRCEFRR
jgi:hypothetical protein